MEINRIIKNKLINSIKSEIIRRFCLTDNIKTAMNQILKLC